MVLQMSTSYTKKSQPVMFQPMLGSGYDKLHAVLLVHPDSVLSAFKGFQTQLMINLSIQILYQLMIQWRP